MTKEAAKQKLVGMYRINDPTAHKVQVGKFTILRHDNSSVWIQLEDAEGMQVDDALFEAFITKFFWERF
jgi:hypothetical protein